MGGGNEDGSQGKGCILMIQPPKVERPEIKYTDRELWEKYWIVTQELLKFIKAEDIDGFLDLVNQRQKLMEMMQALPEEEQDFRRTPESDELREKIKPMDMQIMYKARTWLNKSRRNNEVVRGYGDGDFGTRGGRFSRNF